MGMVKIGDRDLNVREKHERGSFQVDVDTAKARKALKLATDDEEVFRCLASIVLCYVAHNEPPVTLEWLISVLPSDMGEITRQCIVASGREAVAPQGEAARP